MLDDEFTAGQKLLPLPTGPSSEQFTLNVTGVFIVAQWATGFLNGLFFEEADLGNLIMTGSGVGPADTRGAMQLIECPYRGSSLIRKCPPPGTTIGPEA